MSYPRDPAAVIAQNILDTAADFVRDHPALYGQLIDLLRDEAFALQQDAYRDAADDRGDAP